MLDTSTALVLSVARIKHLASSVILLNHIAKGSIPLLPLMGDDVFFGEIIYFNYYIAH
jgi:hypothetical protein